MKYRQHHILFICVVIIAFVISYGYVSASLVPNLVVTANTASDGAKVTVFGADPNSLVTMFYQSYASTASRVIGTTDGTGYFSVVAYTETYKIDPGSSVYIIVNGQTSRSSTWPQSSSADLIGLNKTDVSVISGQSATVRSSKYSNLVLGGNIDNTVAQVSVSGNIVTINGLNVGSTTARVCVSDVGCTAISIRVQISGSSAVTFSKSNLEMRIGDTQTVDIFGPGQPYYVSENPASSSVTVNINGDRMDVIAQAFGGGNIYVCASTIQCGSFYVYVLPGSVPVATPVTVSRAPALSSFVVSANNFGGFLDSGNVLNITVSTNQNVKVPEVTISGKRIDMFGNNNGPFSGKYTIQSTDSRPMPVSVRITNDAGLSTTEYFSLGQGSGSQTPISGNVTSAQASSVTSNSSSAVIFYRTLDVGSTGSDVTALQQRLTKEGVYSGPITGKFGYLTQVAVKAYQARNNLNQVGVVGPATRALLNE